MNQYIIFVMDINELVSWAPKNSFRYGDLPFLWVATHYPQGFREQSTHCQAPTPGHWLQTPADWFRMVVQLQWVSLTTERCTQGCPLLKKQGGSEKKQKTRGMASFELYNFDWDGLLISFLKILELSLGNSWFSLSVCPFKLRIYMWKWHPFFFFLTLPTGMQRKLVVRKNEAYILRETRVRSRERTSWVLSSSIVLGSRPFLRSRCILVLGFSERIRILL